MDDKPCLRSIVSDHQGVSSAPNARWFHVLKVGMDKLTSLLYAHLGGSRDNFLGFTKPAWFAVEFIAIGVAYRVVETSFTTLLCTKYAEAYAGVVHGIKDDVIDGTGLSQH